MDGKVCPLKMELPSHEKQWVIPNGMNLPNLGFLKLVYIYSILFMEDVMDNVLMETVL